MRNKLPFRLTPNNLDVLLISHLTNPNQIHEDADFILAI